MFKLSGKFFNELQISNVGGYVEVMVSNEDEESTAIIIFPGQIDDVINALKECKKKAEQARGK